MSTDLLKELLETLALAERVTTDAATILKAYSDAAEDTSPEEWLEPHIKGWSAQHYKFVLALLVVAMVDDRGEFDHLKRYTSMSGGDRPTDLSTNGLEALAFYEAWLAKKPEDVHTILHNSSSFHLILGLTATFDGAIQMLEQLGAPREKVIDTLRRILVNLPGGQR